MDSSLRIKPNPSIRKSYAPRDPVPVREAVEIDLDGARAVTATGNGAGKQGDHRPDHPAHDHTPHDHPTHDHTPQDVVIDPESRDVIYRERDVRALDREHPDQALLRLRAYRPAPIDGENPGENPPAGEPHADLEA